jgi:polyhydroxyalkanoate synthase
VLGGRELSNIFLWLRPNDLVWNYWVNNYLMGNDPPAFDILAWNADPTNLTAGLHSDFLDIFSGNSLVDGAGLSVLGEPVTLADVRCENYIVGGLTDHLVPWQACYRGTQVLGGPSTFVLTGTGHIQSIINAPGDPRMRLWKDGPQVADPDRWLAGATLHHPATWWEDWGRWVGERGGEPRAAPSKLGNRRYRPTDAAPGTYLYASC